MSTKNLLILTDWYVPGFKAGGPITSIVNLVKLLHSHYNIFIVTGDRDLGDTKAYSDIQTNTWIKGENNEQIFYCHQNKVSKNLLNTIIEVSKPNFIYYNSLFSIQFFIKPQLILKNRGIKSYLSPRGMLHPQAYSQKSFKKRTFVKVSRILGLFKNLHFLATDAKEKEYIKAAGFKKNQISISPNIPDISFFDLPLSKHNNKHITIVSRIAPEKNSLKALEVLTKLKGNITCHWIGEGKDPEYTNQFKFHEKQIPTNIKLVTHGGLTKTEIKATLQKCSFFFLPTLGENFGHAIYEALASGKPSVIGSNTPFIDIVKHQAGFAVDATDTDLLTEKLQELLNLTDEKYHSTAQNARNFAKHEFNADEALKVYMDLWS